MCAALELNSRIIRPGKWIGVWRNSGRERVLWAGFARHEILPWWQRKGGEMVDIPADRFAERSDQTRALIWEQIPDGEVVRGLIDTTRGQALLKVVTRPSTDEELRHFQHPRMPLVEPPIFRADRFEVADESPAQIQQELF